MFVFGSGISFIISLFSIIVIGTYRFLRKLISKNYRRSFISPSFTSFKNLKIIFGVALSTFIIGTLSIESSLFLIKETKEDNNLVFLQDTLYRCEQGKIVLGEKNIVIRVDDVQAFGWVDIFSKMVEDTKKLDYPIVAGVIPKGLNNDKKLVKLLNKESCRIELAMHGYTHRQGELDETSFKGETFFDNDDESGEFKFLNADSARKRLSSGRIELEKFWKGDIVTFIPPQNKISTEAVSVLAESGFKVLSVEGERYFDYDASTWDFISDSFNGSENVIAECEKTFKSEKKVCVIMFHPQDFAKVNGEIDLVKYGKFLEILEYARRKDIKVVRFEDLTGYKLAFNREMKLGYTGYDVKMLRNVLIEKNAGPYARSLVEGVNFDDFFGGELREALLEFQRTTFVEGEYQEGVFDEKTREYFNENDLAGLWL